jgi:hypothetical protein
MDGFFNRNSGYSPIATYFPGSKSDFLEKYQAEAAWSSESPKSLWDRSLEKGNRSNRPKNYLAIQSEAFDCNVDFPDIGSILGLSCFPNHLEKRHVPKESDTLRPGPAPKECGRGRPVPLVDLCLCNFLYFAFPRAEREHTRIPYERDQQAVDSLAFELQETAYTSMMSGVQTRDQDD